MNYWQKYKSQIEEKFGRKIGTPESKAYEIHCAYCGIALSEGDDASADHVIPRSKGGKDEFENIVPCCRSCNSKKRNLIFGDEWVPDEIDPEVMERYIDQINYVLYRAEGGEADSIQEAWFSKMEDSQ